MGVCAADGKLAGVVGMRVCKVESEVPSALGTRYQGAHLPLAGSTLPSHQVQLSVMQIYRITMQSALRASGCNPRKLDPDEPWSWLLGQFIQQHRIPTASVHLCWLQWYLQALQHVKNKLDVLRTGVHLDSFERTQLDSLQIDVRSLLLLSAA
jgi:hypothetical protein